MTAAVTRLKMQAIRALDWLMPLSVNTTRSSSSAERERERAEERDLNLFKRAAIKAMF